MIGLGADDVRIELDQVFVPVRISRRLDHLDTFDGLDGDPSPRDGIADLEARRVGDGLEQSDRERREP